MKTDEALIYIDGQFYDRETAKVSVFDHGFLFGDSIYEVMRFHQGVPIGFDQHMRRFMHSGERIRLDQIPDLDFLRAEMVRTIQAWSERHPGYNKNCYLRVILTRGVGPLTIDPSDCTTRTLILIVLPYHQPPQAWYDSGISIRIADVQRTTRESVDPAIKSGNYLNSVMAIIEARKHGAVDSVMVNREGFLTEATTSNLFFVKSGRLFTPQLKAGILEGVTRGLILELCAELGLAVEEGTYRPEELKAADEVFISGSMKDIVPVACIDETQVGSGSPGPVTRNLMARFQSRKQMLLDRDRARFSAS